MHTPVLLEEVVENLRIKETGIYLDLTIGYAGHASAILQKAKKGFLVGIDKDQKALEYSQKKLLEIGANFELIHGDFRDIDLLLKDSNFQTFDGIFGDLGVSSPQIDDPSRGFSYSKTGPLDMRMDQRQTLSANQVVNKMDQEELSALLEEFAFKKYGKSLAKAIVQARPILDTTHLVEVIKKSLPAFLVRKKNPAKVVFQALRIFVNRELEALEELLKKLEKFCKPNCVVALISFHSLEDRLIKNYFNLRKAFSDNYRKITASRYFFQTKTFKAKEAEVLRNPRARSAKLRVLIQKENTKEMTNG